MAKKHLKLIVQAFSDSRHEDTPGVEMIWYGKEMEHKSSPE
jgi:hypothetical protein